MVQETLPHDELVEELRTLSTAPRSDEAARRLRELLDRQPNRDVAKALLALKWQELGNFLGRLSDATLAEVVAELEPIEGAELLLRLNRVRAGDVLNDMDPDDATDVLSAVGTIDEPAEEALLHVMQPDEAADVRQLMTYRAESAGGRMTTRVASLPSDVAADEALRRLRELAREPRIETVYYLYVTDADRRLLGVLSLRELVLAHPNAQLQAIMHRSFAAVLPTADQEEAARILTDKHLLALPVVDAGGRLLGIVTIDDVAHVIEEEATEDIHRLAGVYDEETALTPLTRSLRARVPWLLVNLLTAFLAASVVAPFEGTIAQVAALAVFMPVIAGHGGNTGTQVATIVVRSLAVEEVTVRDAWRITRKELGFGLIHGVLAGAVTAGYALVLSRNVWLGAVVVFAMVANVIMAGLVGSLIPLLLRRLRPDPALASAIWLTTFTDMFGFLVLLGTGALLVNQLN